MSEHPQADEHLTELLSPQLYIYSSLAQSVEHLTVNQGVAGSSPAGGAKQKPEANASGFLFGSLFLPDSNPTATSAHA